MKTELDRCVKRFSFAPLSGIPVEAIRALASVVIVVHFLLDLLSRARPLIQHIGPPGSGKTYAARVIGSVTEGQVPYEAIATPSSARDFWIHISKHHLTIFDNVEEVPKWLNDALAAATSGGIHTERMLYSDEKEITFRAAGILHVTTFSGAVTRGTLPATRLSLVRGRWAAYPARGRARGLRKASMAPSKRCMERGLRAFHGVRCYTTALG